MAFGEEGYNPFQAEHAQCSWCGTMLRGKHKDKVFNERKDASGQIIPLYAADEERVYYEEEAKEAGKRHNVSGSMCANCFQDTKARLKQEQAKAEARRQSGAAHRAEVKAERAAAHEKHKEQIAAQAEYNETVLPAVRARRAYAERARLSAEKVEGKNGLPPGENDVG